MHYAISRHFQRYEVIIESGVADGKRVIDIGCGSGYGTALLSGRASYAVGIDPTLNTTGRITILPVLEPERPMALNLASYKIEDIPNDSFDLAVAVEVFEHVDDPEAFVKKVSEVAKEAFFTTPLSDVTKSSRNKSHKAEYSHADFIWVLSTVFDINKVRFQTWDLRILEDEPQYTGDTMNYDHGVQMAWCTRKGASDVKKD